MKMTTLKSVAIAVGLASSAFGQATSPIVGFTTSTVFDGGVTLLAPGFENAAEFQGSISGIDAAGTTLTLEGASFTSGEFNEIVGNPGFPNRTATYYLEVVGGENDGFWTQIISNTENSVTIDAEMSNIVTSTSTVAVRRHFTIRDYFGEASDSPLDRGTSAADADVITILDPLGGSTTVIFSVDPAAAGGIEGWFTSAFSAADDFPIYPDLGVQVSRAAGLGDVTFVHAGSLDSNARMVSIAEGINVKPVGNPVGYTLNNSGLLGVVNQGSDTSSGDSITTLGDPSVSGSTAVFFEADPALTGGATGFFNSSFAPAGDVTLSEAFVFNRQPGTGVLTYTIPAPVVSN